MTAFWFARTKYQPVYETARAHALLADCRTVWLEPLDAKQKAAALAFIKEAEPLLVTVFAASPFLTRLIRTRPHVLAEFVDMGDSANSTNSANPANSTNSADSANPANSTNDKKFALPEQIINALLQNVPQEAANCENRADLMACLRHARHQLALVTALADIADYWTVEKTTATLSDFADISVRAALDWLLAEAQHEGKRIGQESPAQSGLTILAMGKHGGRELNYSSDIDLVVFYEPSRLALAKNNSENRFFVTLVQDLVSVLQTPTEDGHVFRVDLRLRPDPGATQIAVSLPAAVLYYETMGQNWERAAFIKARPIAGDIELGKEFLATIQPFIWRRNLDFAAIEDVHAMKRQIHVLRGHSKIAVEGHNVKLGRGGIREIEFFVQTQQLIAGGRDASLRGAVTCDVLYALAKAEWISEQTAQELVASYHYLRRVEHRIQMIDDEQTHILPKQKTDMARFARFMGYANRADFAAALTKQLAQVQHHYAALFEAGEALAAKTGNLVFTGAQDDPDTLATLADMGFTNPAHIAAQIRNWHTGRFAATHTQRAKELLTRLMPQLLEALAATPNPDFAFARFHDFLTNLPAGVQLFSLFQSNP
ncbi:MAG: bifunctional [glutamine synthetase] adenylyltransferase/[glutamine synthetase]-adenylyl-L-tyrosine phosphorylase, partial [Alphaproteobacteria bacterium]|nr:bifunctional [glutamine synthetase] adenylyltransferase/[glutamine synthetase]-adenylyl-L-tyrosine phosphorylase [Alphaproteobacteria bacterium]